MSTATMMACARSDATVHHVVSLAVHAAMVSLAFNAISPAMSARPIPV